MRPTNTYINVLRVRKPSQYCKIEAVEIFSALLISTIVTDTTNLNLADKPDRLLLKENSAHINVLSDNLLFIAYHVIFGALIWQAGISRSRRYSRILRQILDMFCSAKL